MKEIEMDGGSEEGRRRMVEREKERSLLSATSGFSG